LQEDKEVRVEPFPWQGWLYGAIAGMLGSLVLGHIMARYTDASLPHIDASLTAFSLVAQWWTTRKYLANWVLWILVDIIYTAIFAYKNLYLTAGLYFFFVFLAIAGLRSWRTQLALQQSRN